MEVIDEQGRVFGVVNVIDLLVVLFVLAVVAAGAMLVLGGDEAVQGDGATEIESVTVIVLAEEVQPSVAEALPDPGAVDDSNVVSIENKSVRPATLVSVNDSGAVLTRDHPRLKTVELEVTADTTRTESGLRFDGQTLRVGSRINIHTDAVQLKGTVTEIEQNQ